MAGESSLKGFATPQAAIEAFTNPLKQQGSKGVNEGLNALDTLNGDPAASNQSEINNVLTKELKDNGKLVKVKLMDSDSRLNGNMQTLDYELEYLNGHKRQIQIKLLKPSQNSGFHVMGISLE